MPPLSDGLPISFSPVDQLAAEGVVRVSTDYNFLFNFNRIFMAAMWKREPLDKYHTCEKVLCKDIVVHMDTDGIWRLALTDDNPHVVVFRKLEMEQINAI
ncbi:hypothetical protein Scep_024761 [Stephania cephalantha]|uniref:Uncharacterized protein n=1 Tax=Stephania cephalantha TaxID=152367 RepID=A0AAP0EX61_9MAGN